MSRWFFSSLYTIMLSDSSWGCGARYCAGVMSDWVWCGVLSDRIVDAEPIPAKVVAPESSCVYIEFGATSADCFC